VSTEVNASAAKQPFAQHLLELRRRIFWAVMSLLGGGVFGYFIRDHIQAILLDPLNQPVYYTSPTGGFDFLFKLCIFFGFIFAIPIITYQVLKFFEPVIPGKTGKVMVKAMLASVLLTVSGIAFAYFLSLPAALHFLNNFGSDQIRSLISTDSYFSFVMGYLAGYALLFQLPLLMLLINRITPLPPGSIKGKQRWVILISFIVAAVLTPTPDPLNQSIMAVPMIMLYQVSGLLVWWVNLRARRSRIQESRKEARQRKRQAKVQQLEREQAQPQALPDPSLPSYQALAARRHVVPAAIDLSGYQAQPLSDAKPRVSYYNVIDLSNPAA
jgi:sec-independent protein translocase protein TatC